MSKKPTKKVTTRIVTQETEEKEKNPVPGLIKAFLHGEEPYDEALREYQYKIDVYRRQPDNRMAPIKGRTYDNLETILDDLAMRCGNACFRLLVSVYDGEEKLTFVRVDDVVVEYDGADEPIDEIPEPEQQNAAIAMQMQAAQHAHELRMKELECRTAEFKAAMEAKTGGGMKMTEMLTVMQGIMKMSQGIPIVDDGGDGDGGDGFNLKGIMDTVRTVKDLVDISKAGGNHSESTAIVETPK